MAICLCFTVFVGKEKLIGQKNNTITLSYRGVLSLWHIDTFEGGVGSRRLFLNNVAKSFEKKNDGVLIMVSNYTVEGAIQNLKDGKRPDMISFGLGVDVSDLCELELEKDEAYASIGERIYATSWCRGGYVLIAKPGVSIDGHKELPSLVVSQGEYSMPMLALALEGFTVKNIKAMAPSDAYAEFISGKTPYMLGTQRDLVRLSYKNIQAEVLPLGSFCDLYQYIAVSTDDQNKISVSKEFISFLISEDNQKKLSELRLFSTKYFVEYNDGAFADMQKIKANFGVSLFTDRLKVKEIISLSQNALSGDQNALAKIKNIIF